MTTNVPDKTINRHRFGFGIFFILLSIAIVILWTYYFDFEMYYPNVKKDSFNLGRFLWCVSSSFFGFSILAIQGMYNQKSPYLLYTTYYPSILLVISCLVFSIIHLFDKSSSFIFYYLSFAFCFILSFLVDSFWAIIISLTQKAKDRAEK